MKAMQSNSSFDTPNQNIHQELQQLLLSFISLNESVHKIQSKLAYVLLLGYCLSLLYFYWQMLFSSFFLFFNYFTRFFKNICVFYVIRSMDPILWFLDLIFPENSNNILIFLKKSTSSHIIKHNLWFENRKKKY